MTEERELTRWNDQKRQIKNTKHKRDGTYFAARVRRLLALPTCVQAQTKKKQKQT
jgi:hypothetical protein